MNRGRFGALKQHSHSELLSTETFCHKESFLHEKRQPCKTPKESYDDHGNARNCRKIFHCCKAANNRAPRSVSQVPKKVMVAFERTSSTPLGCDSAQVTFTTPARANRTLAETGHDTQ